MGNLFNFIFIHQNFAFRPIIGDDPSTETQRSWKFFSMIAFYFKIQILVIGLAGRGSRSIGLNY